MGLYRFLFGAPCKKITVLIYGHKGWIGTLFVNYIKNKDIEVVLGDSRIEDPDNVRMELLKKKPTHVISFTGRTHGIIDDKVVNTIDYLEYPGKLVENIRDNLFGPIVLAKVCTELDVHYTYLGTGCIFNNVKNELNVLI